MSALLAGLFAAPARATESGSNLERDVMAAELARRGYRIDPAPQGKVITEIECVRYEVFDERDPIPDLFNVFHTTSRDRTIRRELLFAEGESWNQERIDESARNLKALHQLSLVLIVPVREPDEGRVRVLVITKDVWSLRLNSDFEISGSRLNSLLLSPTEENLFGTHAKVAASFSLQRGSYSVGGSLSHERLFGSRLSALVSYGLVFNRDDGEREGFYGSFSYGLPLYSVEQKWGFSTALVVRQYPGREYARSGGLALYDAEVTAEDDRIPYRYDYQRYVAENRVTRSFGRRYKFNLSFGVEANRQVYRLPAGALADPRALAEFVERELPRSETRLSPFAELDSYENRFLKTHELETLGLTEDVRLGHRVIVRAYPASRRVASSRDLFGVFSGVSYTQALGNGVARALIVSAIEASNPEESEGRVGLSLHVATPRLGIGRFVADGTLQNRYRNYLNKKYEIGGGDRLRGYPTDDPTLRGDDALVANVEFRSPGVNILSVECGVVAFYDVGGTADRFRGIELRQAAGAGLRFMMPEFDRMVLRGDWGFPLSPGYSTLPGALFVTFEQAFSMPVLSAPSVVADAL